MIFLKKICFDDYSMFSLNFNVLFSDTPSRFDGNIMIYIYLFNSKWITDEPLDYYRVTSGITRSYPFPLGVILIHQFRSQSNKYGKTPLV
ncbi:hypothetical protein Hanom_Chr01g00035911 [Helianthus anomalus]